MELRITYGKTTVDLSDDELTSRDLADMVAAIETVHDTLGELMLAHARETANRRWHQRQYCDKCMRFKHQLDKLQMIRHNLIERWEETTGMEWDVAEEPAAGTPENDQYKHDPFIPPLYSVRDERPAPENMYQVITRGTETTFRCNQCWNEFYTQRAIESHVSDLDANCDGYMPESIRGMIMAREDSARASTPAEDDHE